MNTKRAIIFASMIWVAGTIGCKDRSKEIESLQKELAELKAKSIQYEEARKELVALKAKMARDEESRMVQTKMEKPRQRELDGSVFIVTKGRENVKMGLVSVSIFDSTQVKNAVQRVRENLRNKAEEILKQAEPFKADVEKARKTYRSFEDESEAAKAQVRAAKKNLISQFNAVVGKSGKSAFEMNDFSWEDPPSYYNEFRDGKEAVAQKKLIYAELRPKVDSAIEEEKRIGPRQTEAGEKLKTMLAAYNHITEPVRGFVSEYKQLCFNALGSPVSSSKTDADGKFKLSLPQIGEFVISASASRVVGNYSESYVWIVSCPFDSKDRGQVFLSNDNEVDNYSGESIVEKLGVDWIPTERELFLR